MLDKHSMEFLLCLKFKNIFPGGSQVTPKSEHEFLMEVQDGIYQERTRTENGQLIICISKHIDFHKSEHNITTGPCFMSSAISRSIVFTNIISEGI